MRLHLKNARLIDGTGRPVQEAAALIIEGDTIVHAGRSRASWPIWSWWTAIRCATSACSRIGSASP